MLGLNISSLCPNLLVLEVYIRPFVLLVMAGSGISGNRLIMNCCLEAIVGSSSQSEDNVIVELLKKLFTNSGNDI